jgi:hypothetical protein
MKIVPDIISKSNTADLGRMTRLLEKNGTKKTIKSTIYGSLFILIEYYRYTYRIFDNVDDPIYSNCSHLTRDGPES